MVGNKAVAELLTVQQCGAERHPGCSCEEEAVPSGGAGSSAENVVARVQRVFHTGNASQAIVQRALKVDDPGGVPKGAPSGTTKAAIVNGYITTLCPLFSVPGDTVKPIGDVCSPPLLASTESCGCLCEMHDLKATKNGVPRDWLIVVDDDQRPGTEDDTDPGRVTVPSGFSRVEHGAWSKSGKRRVYENWLLLAHELCGHALLVAKGVPHTDAPLDGGRPGHGMSVGKENRIAAEHGIPEAEQRGRFGDAHHGESFARVVFGGFPVGGSSAATLSPAERNKFDAATGYLTDPDYKFKADVIGHTDSAGSDAVNKRISLARAKGVRDELVRRRVDPARFLAVRGLGSAECRGPGPQPDCRRVELIMFLLDAASVTHHTGR